MLELMQSALCAMQKADALLERHRTIADENEQQELVKQAAKMGHAGAQAWCRLLAKCEVGSDTDCPATRMTLELLQEEVEDGCPWSTWKLGDVYAHGLSVKIDEAKAAELYAAAVDRGSCDACRRPRSGRRGACRRGGALRDPID